MGEAADPWRRFIALVPGSEIDEGWDAAAYAEEAAELWMAVATTKAASRHQPNKYPGPKSRRAQQQPN